MDNDQCKENQSIPSKHFNNYEFPCWFLSEIHHSGMRLETENEVMLCGCDELSVPSKAQVETESSL